MRHRSDEQRPLDLTYCGSNAELLQRLGPHTTGKGCLYLKRLGESTAPC